MKKETKTFIEWFDSFAEFIFQPQADFLDSVLPVAEIPYERTYLVQLDLEMRPF